MYWFAVSTQWIDLRYLDLFLPTSVCLINVFLYYHWSTHSHNILIMICGKDFTHVVYLCLNQRIHKGRRKIIIMTMGTKAFLLLLIGQCGILKEKKMVCVGSHYSDFILHAVWRMPWLKWWSFESTSVTMAGRDEDIFP